MTKKHIGAELRPIATWLTEEQLAKFRLVAERHNVTPTALLRAVVVDVIAEEAPVLPLPLRYAGPNLFQLLEETA